MQQSPACHVVLRFASGVPQPVRDCGEPECHRFEARMEYVERRRSQPQPLDQTRGVERVVGVAFPGEERQQRQAVAFRLAAIADRLRDAGCEPAHYVASGGLLNSPAWAKLLADVLGRPLTLSPLQQATARGAALVALEALGAVPSALEVPTPPGRLIEPDVHRHAAYEASRARHERVYAHWRDANAP